MSKCKQFPFDWILGGGGGGDLGKVFAEGSSFFLVPFMIYLETLGKVFAGGLNLYALHFLICTIYLLRGSIRWLLLILTPPLLVFVVPSSFVPIGRQQLL